MGIGFFSGIWIGFFNIFTLPLAWACKRCFSRSFAQGIFSLIFISFRIAEWVSKQAEREREKERQKQLRWRERDKLLNIHLMMQHIHNTSRKLVNELKMPCSKVKHFHIFTFAAAVVLYPLSVKTCLLGTTNSLYVTALW